MSKLIVLTLCLTAPLFIATNLAFAVSGDDSRSNLPSKCVASANQVLMGYGANYSTPVHLDEKGKTVTTDSSKIVKRSLENGVETITYKSKPSYYGYGLNGDLVEHTVALTRDPEGRLTSISSQLDTTAQEKMLAAYGSKLPTVKSYQTDFSYDGSSCDVDQMSDLKKKMPKPNRKQKFILIKSFVTNWLR